MEMDFSLEFMSNEESDVSGTQTQTQTQSQPQTQSSDDTLTDSQEVNQYWAKLEPMNPKAFTTLELVKEKYTAGRDLRNDIVFNENNINQEIVEIGKISSFHFSIERSEISNGIFVVLLCDNSRNGTFVNRRLVGKGKRVVLERNDKIAISKIGHTVFNFTEFTGYMEMNLPNVIRTSYVVLRKLGSGAAGEVDMIFCKTSFHSYAMKSITISKSARNPIKDVNKIANEVNILRKLQHPCIVQMMDIIETPEKVYMILELMEGGELCDRVNRTHGLGEDICKFMFWQITHAVNYLHSQSVTHRDLKPENILLASDDEYPLVKVSDFGLSKIVDSDSICLKTFCGTMLYVAPEILLTHGIGTYTSQVDIWSLGVILYVMLSGMTPFSPNNKQYPLDEQIKRGIYKFPNNKFGKVSLDAKELIKKMLTVNPHKRITIKEILRHNWLTQDVDIKNRVNELIYGRLENENTSPNSASRLCLSVDASHNHVFDIPEPVPKRARLV